MTAVRRRPGRPELPDDQRLVTVHATVTPQHRAALLTEAERQGLSMSTLVRNALDAWLDLHSLEG